MRLVPTLSSLEIRSLSRVNLGKTFRILLRAYNYAGVAESPVLGVVFASVPDQPPIPVKVLEKSNSTQVTVDISDFTEIMNGGCDIVSFDI